MKKKVTPKKAEQIFQIGENYFIQLVTHYYTGKLVDLTATEFVMSDVAWIADTGRLTQFIKNGELNEVEPIFIDRVVLGRGALIAAMRWLHALPKEQK